MTEWPLAACKPRRTSPLDKRHRFIVASRLDSRGKEICQPRKKAANVLKANLVVFTQVGLVSVPCGAKFESARRNHAAQLRLVTGIISASNYRISRTAAHNKSLYPMTTTLPHTLSPEMPSALSQLIAALLEPLFIVITCLFWAVVLPVIGLFRVGVAICDYAKAVSAKEIRFPNLRRGSPIPLVLRHSAKPAIQSTGQSCAAGHAVQA
jgi:hypothetical protein